VCWLDHDGHQHTQAFPRHRFHERRPTLPKELAAGARAIVPGKERKLLEYLGNYRPTARAQSVSQLGWLDGEAEELTYVLPDRGIGAPAESRVLFQPEQHSPTARSMRQSGTLEQWKRHVAARRRGNPILLFSLCTAFAGPLLRFADLDSGGFHLFGTSSQGKTTAPQVAASVSGCGADPGAADESHIRLWNTTGNALEALAAAHNDGLLALDEMGSCDAEDFSKVLYDLAGGQGKSRLTEESALRERRSWRILVLSTGEISVRQRIEEGQRATRRALAGQLTRFVDISPPTGDSTRRRPLDRALVRRTAVAPLPATQHGPCGPGARRRPIGGRTSHPSN
jgi:putative DNA primase/helicase